MKRIISSGLLIFFVIGVVGVLIIKFNTPFAANFADNNLRPLIGDNNVIRLEKIFFNLSDIAQRLTYKNNQNKDSLSTLVQINDFTNLKTKLDVQPIAVDKKFVPEPNEGIWKNIPIKLFPSLSVMASTYVRPDPIRPFAYVNIAQIDTSTLRLGIVAGKVEPAAKVGRPGPGIVPKDIIESGRLVAAFDGGFQYRDGEYGMIVDNYTYLPLKKDIGTIVGYKNGSLKILKYSGQDLGTNVSFIRQNCPILIENGKLAADDPENKKLWGRTITSGILTWRTGLGLTKKGNLVFAVGNNLTPETLGKSLIMAGAVDAIQLDINPYWVRFNIFNSLGNSLYDSRPLSQRLTDGATHYLNGFSKDFFYLYQPDSEIAIKLK